MRVDGRASAEVDDDSRHGRLNGYLAQRATKIA